MLHGPTRGAAHSFDGALFHNATASHAHPPREGFAAPCPASTSTVPPSDRISPTLQRSHSSASGPYTAAHDISTASSSHSLSATPAPPHTPDSLFFASDSAYTFTTGRQYDSGSTSSWSGPAGPRQEEQSSGILRGGAGDRFGSSVDGVRRELTERATYGEEVVSAIKEEDEEVERRERWALGASFAPPVHEQIEGEFAYQQGDVDNGRAGYYYASNSPTFNDIGGEYEFAFDSPGLVASRHGATPQHPFRGASSSYDAYRDVGQGEGSGGYRSHGDDSPISPLSLDADDSHRHTYQRHYGYQEDPNVYEYPSASPELPYQPFFVPAGPQPAPFASISSQFGHAEQHHLTYSYSAPAGSGPYEAVSTRTDSYDFDETDPAAHFAPYYAPHELRTPITAFQSFHFASSSQSPRDELPPRLPSSPQSLPTATSPLFPAYSAPRHLTTSPPSSRHSLLANALNTRPMRPQSNEIAEAFVKVEDPDSPAFLPDSPVLPASSSPRAPPASVRPAKGKKRRSSASASSALDPDWTPSSPPTRASSTYRKVHAGRVSPITGKPVKVISPRRWPPKDQHKRIYACEFPGCDKSCELPRFASRSLPFDRSRN